MPNQPKKEMCPCGCGLSIDTLSLVGVEHEAGESIPENPLKTALIRIAEVIDEINENINQMRDKCYPVNLEDEISDLLKDL
jgi:hypothetical protein